MSIKSFNFLTNITNFNIDKQLIKKLKLLETELYRFYVDSDSIYNQQIKSINEDKNISKFEKTVQIREFKKIHKNNELLKIHKCVNAIIKLISIEDENVLENNTNVKSIKNPDLQFLRFCVKRSSIFICDDLILIGRLLMFEHFIKNRQSYLNVHETTYTIWECIDHITKLEKPLLSVQKIIECLIPGESLLEFKQRLKNDIENDDWCLSTTILKNKKVKDLLCSCAIFDPQYNFDDILNVIKYWKNSAGIGIPLHNIENVVDYMKMFDKIQQLSTQNNVIAFYLEPWHPDIFNFLNSKNKNNNDQLKYQQTALWIPDDFMNAVINNDSWKITNSFELSNYYGQAFTSKYIESEELNKVDANDLFYKIITKMIETGNPYILFKDTCNRLANQQYGTIKSSNLCAEIVQYYDHNKHATCLLGSVNLGKFVVDNTFSFMRLRIAVHKLVDYLNNIHLSLNFDDQRCIGIGVQGFADMLQKLEIPFESDQCFELNSTVFEHLYTYALERSIEWAKKHSKFKFFDKTNMGKNTLHPMFFNKLIKDNVFENFKKYGAFNATLIALMPTSRSAFIYGSSETVEPYYSNIYLNSSEYKTININPNLINYMKKQNLYSNENIKKIVHNRGSIQDLDFFDKKAKDIFKTLWEIDFECLLNLAIDRAPWIDQTQSMSIYMTNPDVQLLKYYLTKAWKHQLKTGCYYLQIKPKTIVSMSDPNSTYVCEQCVL